VKPRRRRAGSKAAGGEGGGGAGGPAPPADVQRQAQLGADLLAVGEAYLAHARQWAAGHHAPAEFTEAMAGLRAALDAHDDGVAIVAAIARLVHHGQPRQMSFGANLHGLSVGLKLWFEQTRLAASKARTVVPNDPEKKRVEHRKIVESYLAMKTVGLGNKAIDGQLRASFGVGVRWAQELAKKSTQ
jgi:hypothetical protein